MSGERAELTGRGPFAAERGPADAERDGHVEEVQLWIARREEPEAGRRMSMPRPPALTLRIDVCLAGA
eukprot:3076933-Rhodomonas_salina.1